MKRPERTLISTQKQTNTPNSEKKPVISLGEPSSRKTTTNPEAIAVKSTIKKRGVENKTDIKEFAKKFSEEVKTYKALVSKFVSGEGDETVSEKTLGTKSDEIRNALKEQLGKMDLPRSIEKVKTQLKEQDSQQKNQITEMLNDMETSQLPKEIDSQSLEKLLENLKESEDYKVLQTMLKSLKDLEDVDEALAKLPGLEKAKTENDLMINLCKVLLFGIFIATCVALPHGLGLILTTLAVLATTSAEAKGRSTEKELKITKDILGNPGVDQS